MDVISVAGKK